jgi:hypothetical protein
LADPIGEIHIAGNTWRELQWPFSVEDMIVLDTADNSVYIVWTYTPSAGFTRRSYFNSFNPETGWSYEEPGYDISPGIYHHKYHSIMLSDNTGGLDNIEIGFDSIDPNERTMRAWWEEDHFERMQLDSINFPSERKVARARDRNDYVHMLGDGSRHDEDFGRLYYGRYKIDRFVFAGWEFVDTLTSSAYKIAASLVSDRVAIAYNRQKRFGRPEWWYSIDNDIYLLDSPDGHHWNWQDRNNLTNFSEDDIFRPVGQTDIFIDYNDQIHVVFTTWEVHVNVDYPESTTVNKYMAFIWHWSEATDSFSVAADGWISDQPPECHLGWHIWSVGRGQLGMNPGNGYLYLLYERNNCEDLSYSALLPNSELWVSVSTDNGLNWSTGTNITDTQTPDCMPGDCASEIQPSMDHLVNDTLHILYILDRDAGIWDLDGYPTENKVIYQKIPADLILTEPLLPQFSIRSDPTTDVKEEYDTPIPTKLSISQNYPNPLNSSTVIEFIIPKPAHITLSIYDLLGRRVAMLVDKEKQAGRHKAIWNASGFSSGVYIISLSDKLEFVTKRIVLIK